MAEIRYRLKTGEMWRTDNGQSLRLFAQRGKLLTLLLSHRGNSVSHNKIMDHLYEGAIAPEGNVVSVYICTLRKFIAGTGWEIKNWHGQGYRICRSVS